MAKAVERRKGTATEHASFTGNDAEITVNTTNKSVHVHDGATAGGYELARTDLSNTSITATITELNYVDGVTSGIQTQLNSKANLSGANFTGSVDVTGTVTADGLTVENNTGSTITLSSTDTAINGGEVLGKIDFYSADASGIGANNRASIEAISADGAGAGDVYIKTSTGGTAVTNRVKVANNGDVSFYEDTGTTAKFVWDSSAESLGIGTASPSAKIHLSGTGETDTKLQMTSGAGLASIDGRYGNLVISADENNAVSGSVMTFRMDGSERARIDSNGRLGIGSTAPTADLHIKGVNAELDIENNTGRRFRIQSTTANSLSFIDKTANSERARIDSIGNLLVAKSAISTATVGHMALSSGLLASTRSGGEVAVLNRLSSDGDIALFRKDGTTVGSIRSRAGLVSTIILDPRSGGGGLTGTQGGVEPVDNSGNNTDGLYSFGTAASRFKDLYLSGGVKYSESTIIVQSGTPTTVASFGAGIGSKFCGIIHVRDTGGTHIGASAIVTSFANGGTASVSIMQTASGASNSTLSVSGANILFSHVYGSGRNFKVTLTPFSTGG